jgi:hypothetical protein
MESIMKPVRAALLILLFTEPVYAAQRSIVGDWRFAEETCASAIRIGPLSLDSDDVACRFTSVKREGNRVTWQGVCDDAEGSSEETVIATETDGALTIRYVNGGNELPGLVRCEK